MNDFSCLLADLRPLNFCSFNWILDSFLLYHNIPPQKSGDVFTTIISRFLSYHILVCLKNQPHFSIPLKQISGIHLPSHIIERVIIAIRNDAMALLFEPCQVIHHKTAKERRTIL